MDSEILKAVNNLSKRLNEVEQKLEQFLLDRQEVTNKGLSDMAETVSVNNFAIEELAGLVSGMMEQE